MSWSGKFGIDSISSFRTEDTSVERFNSKFSPASGDSIPPPSTSVPQTGTCTGSTTLRLGISVANSQKLGRLGPS